MHMVLLLRLLIAALLGYFVNYRQIVLSADQKEYKITLSVQGVKVIKVILQLISIRFLAHGYIWWMGIEVVMAFITSYVLDYNIRKEYPWLNPQVSKGKLLQKKYPGIINKTKQIFFHKIGTFVLTQTSPLVIYAYTSLTLVAMYGNYMLIVIGVTSLVNALLNSINAGVGNLVAEGNKLQIKSVFWELTALRMWIASIVCFGMYMLGDSFIIWWVGEEYILPQSTFIVLILITFITLSRTNDVFLAAYGLYQDIWAPIVEAMLNLGLSILLGYYYGLTGILSGVLISSLVIVYSWKPYFLYSQGFKISVLHYWIGYIKHLLIILLPAIVCYYLFPNNKFTPESSFTHWIVYGAIIISTYGIFTCSLLYLFTPGIRAFAHRILKRHH